MKLRSLKGRALLTCLIVSTGISAPAYSEINYNGFLSAGGGTLIDDDEIKEYKGFDGEWNTNPDTTFGLQITAEITDKVSATGQFVATGDNNYNVEADWAYVSYKINDKWDVRAGRLRAPFFMYSDFLEVGYAYTWIRPPEQTYRFLFSTVEGIDTVYATTIGDWDSTVQAYFGRLNDEHEIAGFRLDLKAVNFTGASWVLANDWAVLRASWNQAEVSFDSPAPLISLFGTLNQLGFGSVADALEVTDENVAFWGLSATIDYHDWLVAAEYTETLVEDQSLVSDDTGWYVMLGRRFGNFILHGTYSKQENHRDFGFLDAIPADVDPGLDALRAGIVASLPKEDNTVMALGVRYDFTDSTAFKVELADLEVLGADGLLLSFSVDLVF
ncbi:MAG: porin [Pseudomonadales bacterium]|nr:porin [Pseudomonadales bacterium]